MMAIEISIDRHPDDPSLYLVDLPEHVSATFHREHRNYFSALAEGLRLQREFRPAVLHDHVAVGGAHDASR